ncbi:helix-turn-helix transcriptional regulator [Nodosilinea sp. LEGE 07298]|uniref:helix-turn-helix transcriptional regulator n=1 Tax=Nodosilinea sp. LEGE 07298 TaxID=2777970 RepID=UPI00187FDEE7|nr:LuxR C-terminal-related transcriptional regulator [Nodosilinea sp. LEGE 07298]MBE9110194.1 helix-turn-helix transcriptional regulator [Nodosilinea sp. LEGE 07298]
METLTSVDWQHLHGFLRSLYTPYSLEAFPETIMAALPEIIGTDTSGFVTFNTQDSRLPRTSNHNVTLPRIITYPDPEIGIAATAFTAQPENFFSHPVATNYLRTLDGQAMAISDFLSEAEFHRQEPLYKGFLEHYGIEDQMGIYITLPMACSGSPVMDLFHRGQEHLSLIISRDRRSFSERDRLILNLIRPHLKQAYDNIIAFNHLHQKIIEKQTAIEQTALIALSTDGTLKWMTPRADEILHCYFPPSQAKMALPDLLQRWVDTHVLSFTDSTEACSTGRAIAIELDGKRLKIRFSYDAKTEQYYLLLEEDQANKFSIESLQLLGLTKREGETLFWIIKSKSIQEVAQRLGLSDRTVKKHLENIYTKFGVHNLTSAITYALNGLGILG